MMNTAKLPSSGDPADRTSGLCQTKKNTLLNKGSVPIQLEGHGLKTSELGSAGRSAYLKQLLFSTFSVV